MIDPKHTQELDATLEWRTRDRDPLNPFSWRNDQEGWNFWLHSHNSMGAFFSGTDYEEMKNMVAERETPFIGMVINAKREYVLSFIYPKQGIILEGQEFTVEKLPSMLEYIGLEPEEQQKQIEKAQHFLKTINNDELNKYEQIQQTTGTYELTKDQKGTSSCFRNWRDWNDYGDDPVEDGNRDIDFIRQRHSRNRKYEQSVFPDRFGWYE